jgi:cytochrome d ubiquinol oxidase subunit I
MTFSGWVATIAGWLVTEIGRQPWLVTGILRTRDAVGDITGAQLGASLSGYIVTYSMLLVSYLVVVTHLARKGADTRGPKPDAHAAVPIAAGTPK